MNKATPDCRKCCGRKQGRWCNRVIGRRGGRWECCSGLKGCRKGSLCGKHLSWIRIVRKSPSCEDLGGKNSKKWKSRCKRPRRPRAGVSWACPRAKADMPGSFLSWVKGWWNLLMLKVLTAKNTRDHSLLWLPDTRFTCTKLSLHSFFYPEEKSKFARREMRTDSLYIRLQRATVLCTIDKPEGSWWYTQKN